MKIPATLKKIRNRCKQHRCSLLPEGSPFGPKRSKSAPFYFQDVNVEDLELLTNGFSTPRKAVTLTRYSCATPDSIASTPGYSRRTAPPPRLLKAQTLGRDVITRSEPVLDPIKQTSIHGVFHRRPLSMAPRPVYLGVSFLKAEDKRKCCSMDDGCMLCTLVRPELRGRHVPRICNPSFVRNFD